METQGGVDDAVFPGNVLGGADDLQTGTPQLKLGGSSGRRVIEGDVGQATQLVLERAVPPAHLGALEAAGDGNHLLVARPQLVDTVFERRCDADALPAETGDVIDAVLERAVGKHVVHQAAGRDRDPVAGLFDPFDVALHLAVVDLPHAAEIGDARGERFPATIE